MNPISTWTALAQEKLEKGEQLYETVLKGYKLKLIFCQNSLWIVAQMKQGGRIAFRAAYAPEDALNNDKVQEIPSGIQFYLSGTIGSWRITLEFPESEFPLLRYTTQFTPNIDLLVPYTPRDIMPLFKSSAKTERTKGTVHVTQVGNRSGQLFFSFDYPKSGSVFYFQNLSALNQYCIDTKTSAGDLVGGSWPEIGMKLPVTPSGNPLRSGTEYILSDAFVLLSDEPSPDNYSIAKQYLDYMAAVYIHLPRPETQYQDWPQFLQNGLSDLQTHKGCWKYMGGRSYLNAYVSDYKTPPESMVQLAVLLPLLDYDAWSGEDHRAVIETLRNGLEDFYDEALGTIVRWLPSMEKNLNWEEEHKRPEVMDSWYLHHPLLNLSRMALDGDGLAKDLLLKSIGYVIKVAHHFNYQWPVFYKMATLEVLKQETAEGKGGEKDVPGAYAHLMIQVWQLTGEKKYFNEAVKAAKVLDGLGFDVFYQANTTAFSSGALLRLYKETGDETFLNLAYLCVAALLSNMQLWESGYGYAQHYPTFFGIFPLKDAPYTAAYEEQEVFSAIHTFLKEAEEIPDFLSSAHLLLTEYIKYVINRVSYYYPTRLPREAIADQKDVKTGEIDPNLWVALEDLQDGWNKSGQVGQEVYGAGIAFGIVPRQYIKMDEGGFMIFCEYPIEESNLGRGKLVFKIKGASSLSCRLVLTAQGTEALDKKIAVHCKTAKKMVALPAVKMNARTLEFIIQGGSVISVS